jgi:hypothetical protein
MLLFDIVPQYVFMAWCLVKHRDNFTFIFVRGGLNSAAIFKDITKTYEEEHLKMEFFKSFKSVAGQW